MLCSSDITILACDAELIPYDPAGSPFKVPVTDVVDSSKVKCSGPGLSPGLVRANVPQSFSVDTSKAGVAPLQVKVQGPKGKMLGRRKCCDGLYVQLLSVRHVNKSVRVL